MKYNEALAIRIAERLMHIADVEEKLSEMEGWNDHLVMEKTKEQVMELLKQVVRPEFLNRVDEIVMFEPLNKENLRKIVEIQFNLVKERLKEQGIIIEASSEALNALAEEGYDPQFGARPLKRVIQKRVLNILSKEILANTIQKDQVILMELGADGEIVFENVEAE